MGIRMLPIDTTSSLSSVAKWRTLKRSFPSKSNSRILNTRPGGAVQTETNPSPSRSDEELRRLNLMKTSSAWRIVLLMVSLVSLSKPSYAAHPLITDDTGTQGAGKSQIELNAEFTRDRETLNEVTTTETGWEVSPIISYGLVESVDMVVGLPYQWGKVKENGEVVEDEKGISDLSLELKWRFWEAEGLSFALKPGVTAPSGKEEKGLGTGKVGYSLTFITSAET